MIVLILTAILIVNWTPVSSSIPDLKCHVTNNTVHMQVTLNTTIPNDTTVVLKTINIHTKTMDLWRQCAVFGSDRKVVRCAVWQGTDKPNPLYHYRYRTYQLTVTAARNSTVYWSRKIGQLHQFMYDCFENHKIENLKITCGDCDDSVASTAKDTQCRRLQWHRQKHDIAYSLIDKHSIKIGQRVVTDKVDLRHCSGTLCIFKNLDHLDECAPEKVCVNTHFKPDCNGVQRPILKQCISTSTMCNRNKCKRNSTSQLRLVLSITLSTAAFILAVLAGVVLHHRYKRRQPTAKSPNDDDVGVVMPRGFEDGLDNDGLHPRNDHDYSYPDFVIPDPDYTEFVLSKLDVAPPDMDSVPSNGELVASNRELIHPDVDFVHSTTEKGDALSVGSNSSEVGSAKTLL